MVHAYHAIRAAGNRSGRLDRRLSLSLHIDKVGIPGKTLEEMKVEQLSNEVKYRENRGVNQRQSNRKSVLLSMRMLDLPAATFFYCQSKFSGANARSGLVSSPTALILIWKQIM